MGETVPGGRYLGTDGEYHDANGNKIGSKENKAAVSEGTATAESRGEVAPKAGKKGAKKAAKKSATKAQAVPTPAPVGAVAIPLRKRSTRTKK